MANIDNLINKKVRGFWGAGIAEDFGKIHSIENGWILIEWDDKRTHQIHMLEFAKFNSINSDPSSPIGIFLVKEDEPTAGKTYQLTGKPGEKTIENGNTWKESEVTDDDLLDIPKFLKEAAE